MPRAGSTLQYNMIRALLKRSDTGDAEGLISPEPGGERFVGIEQLVEWANDIPYHLVKIHKIHPHLTALLDDDRTTVCYIFRDLRDVAVSRMMVWGDKGDALLAGLDEAVRRYWALRQLRDEHPSQFLWQRYRDVVDDLLGATRQAAACFNIELAAAVLGEIAAECSVESVKPRVDQHRAELQSFVQTLKERDPKLAGKLVHRLGRGADPPASSFLDDQSLLTYAHISPYKGAVGTWRDHLDEDMSQTILERYRDWFEDASGADHT